jgi:alpha-L-fucosidase
VNHEYLLNILDGNPKIVPFIEKNFKPNFTYQEFAPQFTAEFYDPIAWADLFSRSGAK